MRAAIQITARMKSTRLPLKAMKEIAGKPMIVHLLDRLKLAQKAELIIVCTSTNPQDDILAEVARREGVECFRGSEDDVLLRLADAARRFGVDVVINCTADNPFVDPIYIDKLIDFHLQEGNDFTRIEGLPFGAFSYAVSLPAMEKAIKIKAESDTEVWGGYFTDTGGFKWGALKVTDKDLIRPEMRLTVDTPDDFCLITEIFDRLYIPGEIFPLRQIIQLLDGEPELMSINMHTEQKPGIPIKLK